MKREHSKKGRTKTNEELVDSIDVEMDIIRDAILCLVGLEELHERAAVSRMQFIELLGSWFLDRGLDWNRRSHHGRDRPSMRQQSECVIEDAATTNQRGTESESTLNRRLQIGDSGKG